MSSNPKRVSNISVSNLFGWASYKLPFPNQDDPEKSKITIFYGDNGSGKTTLLNLVYCLLSSVAGRGEKTYIARTPFSRFAISFGDGTTVEAIRVAPNVLGTYSVEINDPIGSRQVFKLVADQENAITRDETSDACLDALRALNVHLFYLPDDRRVRTTVTRLFSPRPRQGTGYVIVEDEAGADYFETAADRARARERVGRQIDVVEIVRRVHAWLRTNVISASSQGEIGVNSIYLDLLTRLATPWDSSERDVPKLRQIEERLGVLAKRNAEFAVFGLTAPIPAGSLLALLASVPQGREPTIATVFQPYLNSLEARLDALSETYRVISTFVSVLFTPKKFSISVSEGIKIEDRRANAISPALLSSGEKQLLTLLCSTLLARQRATLFLIDEPELSLNIKWQRMLIDALSQCSANSSIQYVLCSHSLEILSKHKDQRVELEGGEGE